MFTERIALHLCIIIIKESWSWETKISRLLNKYLNPDLNCISNEFARINFT